MVSFYADRSGKAFIDRLAGQRGETKADTMRAMLAYAQANMPKRWITIEQHNKLIEQEQRNAEIRRAGTEREWRKAALAERARAERAEAGAAALLVKVAAVEALLPNTDEQFPIFPFQIREAIGADPSGYILIPVAALAAGLSLQEEQE